MNWALLQNTLWVGGGATLMAMTLGFMAALALSMWPRCLRNALLGGAIITLALPPFLVTNTWMHYLGETGAWHDWFPIHLFSPAGAILILALWLWPVTAMAVWSAWQRLEPAHLEAEPDLRGFALLRFLLVPLARGPLAVAGLITFALAANNLTIPALLQVNVYPAEVWLSFSSTFWVTAEGALDWTKAASLSWPLVLLPLAILLFLRRRAFPWPSIRGGTPARLFRRALGVPWTAATLAGVVVLLALSPGLPLWQITGSAQSWSQLPGAVAAGKGAMLNSVGIAALVASACVALALANVLPGQRRSTASWNGNALGTLLWLPFLVPGVLIGIALIQWLNRPGLDWLYQSLGVVVIGLAVRYLAVGWSIARHAIRSTDPDLADAARLEGASRWQLFRHVLWPQIAPQLAAAWGIVFLLCLWDVETLVLIIPPGGETVALRVFNLLHYGHTAHVNALCLVLIGLAVMPLLVWAVGRRLHRACRVWRVAGVLGLALPLVAGGCAPGLASNEARVDSTIFDRVRIIATRGVAPGQVNKPRSVTVDHDDNLYVLDFTGRVQKFSPQGDFLLFWQMPETKQGNPKGLSVDRAGNIIVVEPHYSRVNLFTPGGERLMQWGTKGTNDGEFSFPRAAAVNSLNEWWVSEFGVVDRVQKFSFEPGESPRLQLLAAYGRAGSGPGEFNRAEGLFVDAQDRLRVADAVNHRVQVLDAGGHFLREYGRAGNAAGPTEGNLSANSGTAGSRSSIRKAAPWRFWADQARHRASSTILGAWRSIPKETSTWPIHRIIACKSSCERRNAERRMQR
ncbi:MAG: ABC transporter permease subunit [Verrucomicrobia bacterium]|nr:ABC transporter permease subunit [Verrucomicrobiota bacterium]